MSQYKEFADVYDTFMDNIPYDEWCTYLTSLLKEEGITHGVIAELGCGTGLMSMRLATSGYKVAGIDISEDMLKQAKDKLTPFYEKRIRYFHQDMRTFSLGHQVPAVVSVCDSMNYILSEDDFLSVLNSAKDALYGGGVFIFDLKTIHFYKDILGCSTIADEYDNGSFIWQNTYDEDTFINRYDLSIFKKKFRNIYTKSTETHFQRAYSMETLMFLISQAGFKLEHVYNAFTSSLPDDSSERIYFVLKKEDIFDE